jgi:hypothetical protein
MEWKYWLTRVCVHAYQFVYVFQPFVLIVPGVVVALLYLAHLN